METSVLNQKFVEEVSSSYRGPSASWFSLRFPLAFTLYTYPFGLLLTAYCSRAPKVYSRTSSRRAWSASLLPTG
jgi:hypothetical protein